MTAFAKENNENKMNFKIEMKLKIKFSFTNFIRFFKGNLKDFFKPYDLSVIKFMSIIHKKTPNKPIFSWFLC